MTPEAIKKPIASSVGDYIREGLGGMADSGEGRSGSSSLFHDSKIEQAIRASAHIIDTGVEGNGSLVKVIENFGFKVTDEMKSDKTQFIKALTQFQAHLDLAKTEAEVYLKETILPSRNVSEDDKESIINSFNTSTTLKDFSEFKAETKQFKNDSDFLVKTLSAIRNGLEDSEKSLDPEVFKELTKVVDTQTRAFYETGTVNNAVIQNIFDRVTSLRGDQNERLVSIDDESTVAKVIQQRVQTQVDDMSRNRVRSSVLSSLQEKGLEHTDVATSYIRGDMSTNELIQQVKDKGLMNETDVDSLSEAVSKALSRTSAVAQVNKQMDEDLAPLLIRLGADAKAQIELQRKAHLANEISSEELRKTIEDRLSSLSELTSEQLGQLSLMEVRLKHIDENTDGETLSAADRIRDSNRLEEQERTSNQLKELLDGINTRDNNTVRNSMFEGANSAQDLGEQAMDSLFDKFGYGPEAPDVDYERNRGGGRDNKPRNRAPRGKGFKGLLGRGADMARSGAGAAGDFLKGNARNLGKAAKIGAPLALAYGAYNMWAADNTDERKKSVGSTAGGVIGGALGTLLGPLGTVAGSYIGSEIGEWVAGTDWFSSPQDSIPDKVKEAGPQAELDYIGSVLLPDMQRSLATQSGVYDEDDVEEIKEYALKLRDKIGVEKAKVDPAYEEIMSLAKQNATPEMISVYTNRPVSEIRQVLDSANKATSIAPAGGFTQTSSANTSIPAPKKSEAAASKTVVQPVVHKSEDNRTIINQSVYNRRDRMRDQLRGTY